KGRRVVSPPLVQPIAEFSGAGRAAGSAPGRPQDPCCAGSAAGGGAARPASAGHGGYAGRACARAGARSGDNAAGQERNLHLRRPGIALVRSKLFKNLLLFFFGESHFCSSPCKSPGGQEMLPPVEGFITRGSIARG